MSGVTTGEVHGEGGAYVAGYWVPIEDCPQKFNIEDGSDKTVARARRSATAHSAAKADGTYDVAIIGSGCIGSAIARELSKTTASVIMLEAADDVCQGATKGNSGIVHAGFDDKPGSVRAKLCWKGNQMFPALDDDLHFGYQLTGSLVVARGEEEEATLRELVARGETNGVQNLRIIQQEELRQMEPTIAPEATAALFSPDAGTLIPYEYTIALAENAADNGVEVRTRREVRAIDTVSMAVDEEGQAIEGEGLLELSLSHWEPWAYVESRYKEVNMDKGWRALGEVEETDATPKEEDALGHYYGSGEGEGGPWKDFPQAKKMKQDVTVEDMKVGGSGSRRAMDGVEVGTEKVRAKFVINCAGGASDKVAGMIGDESFTIKPRLGEYVLLKKSSGSQCNHILFPCPGPYGKGVLVQKTLWGNLILGPTARDVHEWPDGPNMDPDSKESILEKILGSCRRLVPGFNTDDSFHSFAGARAKSDRGDWIIEPSAQNPRFIHAAGIDSPGIAGSPAIALEVIDLLKQAGLDAPANPHFNPKRAALIVPKRGDELLDGSALVYTPDGKTQINPEGVAPELNVVCKCEKVTEAEVVDACARSLPIDSTQAARKRTRAGMGGCQGKPWNYGCECRVAQIIARENAAAAASSVAAVGRRPWAATSAFEHRWLTEDDKAKLAELSVPQQEVEQVKAEEEAEAADATAQAKLLEALKKPTFFWKKGKKNA